MHILFSFILVACALNFVDIIISYSTIPFYYLPVNLSSLHPTCLFLLMLFLLAKSFHVSRDLVITTTPLLLLAVYIFFFEAFKGVFGEQKYGLWSYFLFLEIILFLIIYFLCSIHLEFYKDAKQLKTLTERIIIGVILAHILIIVLTKCGVALPFLRNQKGLLHVNGLPTLGVLYFFLGYFDVNNGHKNGFRNGFRFLFVFSYCVLNMSFGNILIVLGIVAWRFFIRIFSTRLSLRLALAFFALTFFFSTSSYYFLLKADLAPQVYSDSYAGEETQIKDAVNIFRSQGSESMTDKFMSITSRTATNHNLILEFGKHPILGNGYASNYDTAVFGYVSHSYLVVMLAAYGLIGAFLIATFLYLYIKSFKSSNAYNLLPGLFIFIAAVFVFSNDLYLWIALVFALLKGFDDLPLLEVPWSTPATSNN